MDTTPFGGLTLETAGSSDSSEGMFGRVGGFRRRSSPRERPGASGRDSRCALCDVRVA